MRRRIVPSQQLDRQVSSSREGARPRRPLQPLKSRATGEGRPERRGPGPARDHPRPSMSVRALSRRSVAKAPADTWATHLRNPGQIRCVRTELEVPDVRSVDRGGPVEWSRPRPRALAPAPRGRSPRHRVWGDQSSRCTVSAEKAGKQIATYSAPSAPGEL